TGNTTPTGDGAGINNRGSSVITNSTISGNRTSFGWGGGIYSSGTSLSLTGVTISDNSADVGGGIFNSNSTANVVNTIVAGNQARTASPDTLGTYVSQGYNLIGDGQSNTTGFSGLGDQVGPATGRINPRLGALAANGGPTQTHAPLSDSPAIDQGTCSRATPADQRGTLRYDFPEILNANGGCDVGAYELEGPLTVSV